MMSSTGSKYIVSRNEDGVIDPIILMRVLETLETQTKIEPQEITIKGYESKRRLEQNNYYWAMISQVVKWLYNHFGSTKDATEIHEQMKTYFQPAIGSYPCQIAYQGKMLDVEVSIHKSTTKNTVKEMAEYTEKVLHYWAEKGVRFTDNRYEEMP